MGKNETTEDHQCKCVVDGVAPKGVYMLVAIRCLNMCTAKNIVWCMCKQCGQICALKKKERRNIRQLQNSIKE